MIGKMLDHNPRLRPSAEELLQSEHLPLKMEDKELVEVRMYIHYIYMDEQLNISTL